MITIYHQKRIEGQHLWWPRDPEPAPWPDRYQKVATVNTDDLDRAWELTNTIDRPWISNEDVQAEPGPHRSSMVGDVFEHNGTPHLVKADGFEVLNIRF